MDKVILQVNDIFSQAWKGCQKPMWFKVLNIDRTTNHIRVECHSFDGKSVFPENWSLVIKYLTGIYVQETLGLDIVFLTMKRQHIYQERLMIGKEVSNERA